MTKVLNQEELFAANEKLKKDRAKLREQRSELNSEKKELERWISNRVKNRVQIIAGRHECSILTTEIMNGMSEYAHWKVIQSSNEENEDRFDDRISEKRHGVFSKLMEIEETMGCQSERIKELERKLKEVAGDQGKA